MWTHNFYQLFSGVFWARYGMLIQDKTVTNVNVAGAFFFICYVVSYLALLADKVCNENTLVHI